MVLLDTLATRYHLLPSEVLIRADTLDYVVMDVATTYQQYLRDKEEAKRKGVAPPAPNLPINTLKDMMERVRGNDGKTD